METSSKGEFYCLFKSEFTLEFCLLKFRPFDRKFICRFSNIHF